MRGGALWMIQHRLTWLLKTIVVLTYPLHVMSYWAEALEDMRYTLRNINTAAKP